jgi:hypothetical protein
MLSATAHLTLDAASVLTGRIEAPAPLDTTHQPR